MPESRPRRGWPRPITPGEMPLHSRTRDSGYSKSERPPRANLGLALRTRASETVKQAQPDGYGPRLGDRIDVHAHYIPDFYREALIDAGLGAPDGIRELPAWDAETALKTMDKLQVGTAMLS